MSTPAVQYTLTGDDVAIAWVERGVGKPLVVSTGPILPLNAGWEPGGLWDRLAAAGEVAKLALFLACDDSAYMNGVEFRIGRTASTTGSAP